MFRDNMGIFRFPYGAERNPTLDMSFFLTT